MPELRDIPIVALGPGSQPQPDDERLECLGMPADMQTYSPPPLPEPDEATDCTAGKRVLERVLAALRAYRPGSAARTIALDGLGPADRSFVDQALGEGEVSMVCDGLSPIRAQEGVLAGVWRVQHLDADERVVRDSVEVGAMPEVIRGLTFRDAATRLDTAFDARDQQIQNAPALLVELADALDGYGPGDPAHVLNLTLLPLSEGDRLLLGERLGVGPTTILSRGYGNCRIGSTARRNVWWIKYYNSQDVLILNTIEVVDIPAVALAAPEDIADSAERLDEILELYR